MDYMSDLDFFDDVQRKISEEFPRCLTSHREYDIAEVYTSTKESHVVGKVRIALIQDFDHNVKHVAVLVQSVGPEFKNYPELILKELEEFPQSLFVQKSNAFIEGNTNDSTSLVFSKAVYLYTDHSDISREALSNHFSNFGMKLFMRDAAYWNQHMEMKLPDVFICHDSRDKDGFVRSLAQALSKRLLKVWFDEYSLSIGDSLIDKIDEGLKECRFGIVVISKNFLTRKKWTNREFRSLATKEIDAGRKVILPVWLDVTRDEVKKYSLDLADKIALDAKKGVEIIADKIKAEVRKPYPVETLRERHQVETNTSIAQSDRSILIAGLQEMNTVIGELLSEREAFVARTAAGDLGGANNRVSPKLKNLKVLKTKWLPFLPTRYISETDRFGLIYGNWMIAVRNAHRGGMEEVARLNNLLEESHRSLLKLTRKVVNTDRE